MICLLLVACVLLCFLVLIIGVGGLRLNWFVVWYVNSVGILRYNIACVGFAGLVIWLC